MILRTMTTRLVLTLAVLIGSATVLPAQTASNCEDPAVLSSGLIASWSTVGTSPNPNGEFEFYAEFTPLVSIAGFIALQPSTTNTRADVFDECDGPLTTSDLAGQTLVFESGVRHIIRVTTNGGQSGTIGVAPVPAVPGSTCVNALDLAFGSSSVDAQEIPPLATSPDFRRMWFAATSPNGNEINIGGVDLTPRRGCPPAAPFINFTSRIGVSGTEVALFSRDFPIFSGPTTADVTIEGTTPVPGDRCSNPVSIAPNSTTMIAALGAAIESPFPDGCTLGLGAGDVWVEMDLPSGDTQIVELAVSTPGASPAIEVFDQCGGTSLACGSSVAEVFPGGSTLLFRISRSPSPQGIQLLTASEAVAVNDECANSLPIFDGPNALDLSGATESAGFSGKDLWFNYVASCDGELRFENSTGGFAFKDAFTACGGPIVAQNAPTNCNQSILVEAGISYIFRAIMSNRPSADVTLVCQPVQSADLCTDPVPVVPGSSVAFDTANASTIDSTLGTDGSGVPDCQVDLHYEYTAAAPERVAAIVESGASLLGPRVTIVEDCDLPPTSRSSTTAQSGESIQFRLSGPLSQPIDGLLTILTSPIDSDTCASPTPLSSPIFSSIPSESSAEIAWYSFTPPNDAFVSIERRLGSAAGGTDVPRVRLDCDSTAFLEAGEGFATFVPAGTPALIPLTRNGVYEIRSVPAIDATGAIAVVDAEGTGAIDSVAAVTTALTAQGESFVVVDLVTEILGTPRAVFVLFGTDPAGRPSFTVESNRLSLYDFNAVPVLVSGGSYWESPGTESTVDGFGPTLPDLNDSIQQVVGLGSFAFPLGTYTNENVGPDFLSTFPAIAVPATELPGLKTDLIEDGLGRVVAVGYDSIQFAGRISMTVEIGGLPDPAQFVANAVAFLDSTVSDPNFRLRLGDANGDGSASIADVIVALQVIIGTGTTDCLASIDLDANEQLALTDVLLLLQALSGTGAASGLVGTCGVPASLLDCNVSSCP